MLVTKDIPGFPGYKARSDGVIIGTFGRPRKPTVTPRGYERVCVCLPTDRTKRKAFSVHRLICTAFHPPPLPIERLVVDHINGKKSDNRPENLRWCTPRLNQLYHFNPNSKGVYPTSFNTWRVRMQVLGKRVQKHFSTLKEARRYAMELKAERLAEAEAEFAQMIAEYRSQQDNALGTN